MSSRVCQDMQSCLDPCILMKKLTQNNPNLNKNQEQKEEGWSFIRALTNTSNYNNKQGTETEQSVYVHPLVKRSSSTLSMKSLEMCTESLGSETGSNISENLDDFSDQQHNNNNNINGIHRSKTRESFKKQDRAVNFPPPLTSISGSDSFQVRPHREGGRLVLKAVTVMTCSNTFFQAERADGRLRLSFLKGSVALDSHDNGLGDSIEDVKNEKECNNCCDDANNGDDDEDDDEINGGSWEDGMKFGRLMSRCKGGNENKGMQNWETFLVPIS